jgi:hypothetical protein
METGAGIIPRLGSSFFAPATWSIPAKNRAVIRKHFFISKGFDIV